MQPAQAQRKVDVRAPADVERRRLAAAIAGATREGERLVGGALRGGSAAEFVLRTGDDPPCPPARDVVAKCLEPADGGRRVLDRRRALPRAHLHLRETGETSRHEPRIAGAARERERALRRSQCRFDAAGEGLHVCQAAQRECLQSCASALLGNCDHCLGVVGRAVDVALRHEALRADVEKRDAKLGVTRCAGQGARHAINRGRVLARPRHFARGAHILVVNAGIGTNARRGHPFRRTLLPGRASRLGLCCMHRLTVLARRDAVKRAHELLDADRLGQVVVHAGGEAQLAVALHRVGGHRDDARPLAVGATRA